MVLLKRKAMVFIIAKFTDVRSVDIAKTIRVFKEKGMAAGRWAHTYASNKLDLNNKIKELVTQGYKITQVYEPCKCAKYYEIIYEIWSSQPLDKEEK